MASRVLEIDRLSPTRRPPGRAIGYHRWTDLLFIHWRLPAERIAALLPPELTLDTWEGDLAFCDGVAVEIFPLRPVDSAARQWRSCRRGH
ncbi:MAG TPA: DUF2071 domain-containing protein [Pirellulales bacterium]|nr:DUF2071 domain-containing protein [Pirellulales bacterium]